jgi:hypothetical protein
VSSPERGLYERLFTEALEEQLEIRRRLSERAILRWPHIVVWAALSLVAPVVAAAERPVDVRVVDVDDWRMPRPHIVRPPGDHTLYVNIELSGPAVATAKATRRLRFNGEDNTGRELSQVTRSVRRDDTFRPLSHRFDGPGRPDRLRLSLALQPASRKATTIRADGLVSLMAYDTIVLEFDDFAKSPGALVDQRMAQAGVRLDVGPPDPGVMTETQAVVMVTGNVDAVEDLEVIDRAGKSFDDDYCAAFGNIGDGPKLPYVVDCPGRVLVGAILQVTLRINVTETVVPIHLVDVPIPKRAATGSR